MNALKTLLTASAAVVAVFGIASCADSDSTPVNPPLPTGAFYNFATYNGSDASACSFTVQREGDAGSAVITFAQTFTDKQIKTGDRVFMAYTTESGKQYVSGAGKLYNFVNVTGGKPVEATAANSARLSTPVKMEEMKRTGGYLNMVFRIPVNRNLKNLCLTEETNTKDPAYPVLALFIESDVQEGEYRQGRVSFDVTDVLAPADVKGIRVAYKGDAGLDTITFNKIDAGTIKPIE